MTNKYPGTCTGCGHHVAAGAGRAFKLGTRWAVSHNGTCSTTRNPVAMPRRAGHERSYKEVHGRCEDAPCCGCCGPGSGESDYMTGYGDYSNDF